MGNLLIADGLLIDGTGSPGIRADLRVRDGFIAEFGKGLTPRSDEQVIAVDGAVVAPGFIDSHTHFDATIYWDPLCDPIGAALSRMELKIAAVEIVQRLDNIELAIPVDEVSYLPNGAMQTIERLPLTFSRRTPAN